MNVSEKSFSRREIIAVVTFFVLAVALGFGAYQTGIRMAGTGSGAVVAATPASATPDGQALFVGNCAGCHGAQAEGGVGPALGEAAAWSAPEFAQAVLNGVGPGGRALAPVMPHFAQTGLDGAPATDAQVEAIRTFIQGVQ